MTDAQLVENEDGSWLLQGELGFDSVLSVLQHAGVNMLGNKKLFELVNRAFYEFLPERRR